MSTIEELDPYGTDLALSPSGDLIVNSAGSLSATGGVNVLAQAIWLRSLTTPGELVLHPDFGLEHPIGSKMNPAALGAVVSSELAAIPSHDPRFQSVELKNVETPVLGDTDAVALNIRATAVDGTTLDISGLPGEVRVTEVTPAQEEGPLAELEEELDFGTEEEGSELADFNATQSLIDDMEGPE